MSFYTSNASTLLNFLFVFSDSAWSFPNNCSTLPVCDGFIAFNPSGVMLIDFISLFFSSSNYVTQKKLSYKAARSNASYAAQRYSYRYGFTKSTRTLVYSFLI